MSRQLLARRWWLLALLLMAGGAWADYKAEYRAGLDAADKGNWAEVQRRMRAAIAERPDAGRVKLYGSILDPYVPYYYLGIASAQLGDCAAAVQAFKDSGSRNIVQAQAALAKAMAQQETRCQGLLAQADAPKLPETAGKPPVTSPTTTSDTSPVVADSSRPAPTTTTSPTTTLPTTSVPVAPPMPAAVALSEQRIAPAKAALGRVNTQIGGIQSQLQQPPLAGTTDARALNDELARLSGQRQQLASQLERARVSGDASALAKVESAAVALESGLGSLANKAVSAGQGLQAQALDQARKRAANALVSLDQSLAKAAANAIGNAPTVTAASALRVPLQQAATATDRGAIERLVAQAAAASKQLDQAIAAAPKPAPEPLRAIAALYLTGKYGEAAAWNELERLPDARARAQARLLRAAARWRLYVRGGEQDGDLIAAVDSDLREAKRLDRALKPNPQAFSPKLVARFATL